MEEVEKGKWSDGVYTVVHGVRSEGKNIYHIYRSGKYVAQRRSLEDAVQWAADDRKGS